MSWDHIQTMGIVRTSMEKIEKKTTTECQTQISSYQLLLPSIRDKKRQYQQLKWRNANFKQQFLGDLLEFILSRRKRFCFQVLKQFFLFPDETYSQDLSINTYDGLIVSEEPIHTFVKIYQTKELETIIWAFLNIKMLHLHQKLTTFIGNIQGVKTRIEKQQKKQGFHFIQEYSIKIKPPPKQKKRTHRIARTAEKNIRLNRPSLIKIEPIKISHYSPTTKHIPPTDHLKTESKKMPTIKQIPTYNYQKPVHSNCVHIYGCCAINTFHHLHEGCGMHQPNFHGYNEGVHQCVHSHCQNYNSYQNEMELRYNIEERIKYLRRLEEIHEERGQTERK